MNEPVNEISSSAPRLLVVDDDSELRTLLHDLLTEEGYLVDDAATLDQALGLIGAHVYHLILTDLMTHAPGDPLRSALSIREQAQPTPVAALTGWNVTATEVRRAGLARLISKPFDITELVRAVATCLPPTTLSAEQQRQAQVAHAFFAAFNTHDADACLAHFTDDVRIEPPAKPLWASGEVVAGQRACRERLAADWSARPDLTIEEYLVFAQPHGLDVRCAKSWLSAETDERMQVAETMTISFSGERISAISVRTGDPRWRPPLAEAAYPPSAHTHLESGPLE